MSRVGWGSYGNRYTAKDRDLDEKRSALTPGYCEVCRRKMPCRFHGEAA